MKKLLLISLIFCSCSIHKISFTSDGEKDRGTLHQTTRPDTCRKSRLTYVYYRGKKIIDTSKIKNEIYARRND
jgi:hypothetical protein